MSKIRHKLFKIKVTNGKIYPNQKVFSEINEFLDKGNHVYVNHSIATIFDNNLVNTSNIPSYVPETPGHNPVFKYEVRATFLVVSLVYKDMSDYGEDISNLSEKSKRLITKSILEEKEVSKPNFNTEIDIKNK